MFDPSVITEVLPPSREGSRVTLEWTSSAPAGTWFQLYLQGKLAWWGTERHVTVAAPRGLIDGQIGAVADGEQTTDFSGVGFSAGGYSNSGYSGLSTAAIATRARLAWTGFGAAGYRIYESGAGYGQSGYSTGGYDGSGGYGAGGYGAGGYDGSAGTLLADVTALEGGLSTDGYDHGGYDSGGFDTQGGAYSWTSNPLTSGAWTFRVAPYDAAGNEATGGTTTVTIAAPPRPPGANGNGKRLIYTYNPSTHLVTLTWLASPG